MLANLLLFYYVISLLYIGGMILLKKEGVFLRAMIVFACPFISIFLLYAMARKPSHSSALPEWLLKREQYDDVVLRSPDVQMEKNTIPFNDALILNDNKTKRRILIDLLKGTFNKNIDALEAALQSDDSETSHYAATALQHTKSDLLNRMNLLENQLKEDSHDYAVLAAYRDTLKKYIQIEFLDDQTRRRFMYTYMQTLEKCIRLEPLRDKENYTEKIQTAISLEEDSEARACAEQFLTLFPNHEDAYFSAMKVHFKMKNILEFKQIMNRLRLSEIQLSPNRLNQLRFWLQGDVDEK